MVSKPAVKRVGSPERCVLILVVVEYGLEDLNIRAVVDTNVLILVVVEYGLEGEQRRTQEMIQVRS